MSLEVYNDILSKMLNTRQVLTKMRSELEGRKGKKCWECKQFGHLAKNCRNKGGREEVDKQIQDPDKQGNAVWSKGGEETRDDKRRGEILWMW